MTDWRNLSKAEQLKFYKNCKELYYTTGESPIEDFEFDELQALLGLENKDTVPTRRNPKYTIEHPVKMGSLSKVQIKKTNNGVIPWETFFTNIKKFVCRNNKNPELLATPKFDGCSFEIQLNDIGNIVNISGRGDGEYGTDYTKQLKGHAELACQNFKGLGYEFILRGEVLIDKNIFLRKYSVIADSENGFANPRSWVAGLLGRDFEAKNPEYREMLEDISIVIYDIKRKSNNDGDWYDTDWTEYRDIIPNNYLPSFYEENIQLNTVEDFVNLYYKFNDYRINDCKFALDGIVIKPTSEYRNYKKDDYRPKDCVAVKFMPQLQETEVIDISWKLGEKSGELIPTIITKPVEMDGKQISRAAASNYGKLINKKISIGTKVILSLAGDIIPFIYRITDTSAFDESKLNIPATYETYIAEGTPDKDGEKVMKLKVILSDEDRRKMNFIVSSKTLNIPNLGGALTEVLYNYLSNVAVPDETDDFFGFNMTTIVTPTVPDNILLVTPTDIENAIGGKNGTKIAKEFKKVIETLTLKDIIMSCNFKSCGAKVSEQCANYLMGENYDFAHLSKDAYSWCLDENNCTADGPTENLQRLLSIVTNFGKTFDDYKVVISEEEKAFIAEQIPVILTGEPNDYSSKGEFLKCHPEYRLTGKWTEVKIVFTNSIESNTGKMKKAREKGIEIRVY